MDTPIIFQWTGEAMVPKSPFWAHRADAAYVVGETYKMVEHHDRSANSHRHFFATIHDAWQTLPDELLEVYPTSEHLRKKALIRTGHRDERSFVCSSKAEALRFAAFLRPVNDYAIIDVREAVVREWTAKSQSTKAMGAKAFQQSKSDVLDFIDAVLGVAKGETAENSAKAA
jgi:hypothetical protein